MNAEQRKKIVADGNIRSVYGGKKEPLVHLTLLFAPYAVLFINYGKDSIGWYLIPLFLFSVLINGYSAASYLWVARIQMISNEVEISDVKKYIDGIGLQTVSKGRYFVEAYSPQESILGKNTHVLFFKLGQRVYASSWRYSSHAWHYLPTFSGAAVLEEIMSQVSANKALKADAHTARAV